jgi:hypothetical protein
MRDHDIVCHNERKVGGEIGGNFRCAETVEIDSLNSDTAGPLLIIHRGGGVMRLQIYGDCSVRRRSNTSVSKRTSSQAYLVWHNEDELYADRTTRSHPVNSGLPKKKKNLWAWYGPSVSRISVQDGQAKEQGGRRRREA